MNLESLELRDNAVRSLPSSAAGLTGLHLLDLGGNLLDQVVRCRVLYFDSVLLNLLCNFFNVIFTIPWYGVEYSDVFVGSYASISQKHTSKLHQLVLTNTCCSV